MTHRDLEIYIGPLYIIIVIILNQKGQAQMNTPLVIVSDALEAFKDFTGDGDVQIQTVQTFLKIVLAGGATANFDDIAKATGVSQAAVSRNIKKMAEGPRQTEGYGLIHVELDPYDSRRRIITLSPRGKELAASMEARMMPGMLRYLAKQGVTA